MGKAYLVVEGHGEQEAMRSLAYSLWADLGLDPVVWAPPIRGTDVKTRAGILKACELLRSHGDCERALILRDADDDGDCPAAPGPETAGWVVAAKLSFPVAVVLARREYEAWFLALPPRPPPPPIAGREIRPGVAIPLGATIFEGDPEETRGAKEWLTKRYPPGRPTGPARTSSRSRGCSTSRCCARAGCARSGRWSGRCSSWQRRRVRHACPRRRSGESAENGAARRKR